MSFTKSSVKTRVAGIACLGFMLMIWGCSEPAPEGVQVRATDVEMEPPVAEKGDHVWNYHGEDIPDPYAWLNEKESPKTIAYLEAENAYADAALASMDPLKETVYEEMVARLKEDDQSVPVKKDNYFYYSRTEKGLQYSIYCRKQGSLDADEEILLNQNEMVEEDEYSRLGIYAVSPDHSILAYGIDDTGAESYTIRFKNLETGELHEDVIEGAYYSFVWAADGKTVFYNTFDDAHRPYRMWRHVLGTPQSEDVLMFEEPDEKYFLGFSKSRSDDYIFLRLGSNVTTEVLFIPGDEPTAEFTSLVPRVQGVEADVEHQGDAFWILTNEDAVGFKLMKTPVNSPDKANWEEVIAHTKGVTLEDVEGFENHLVVSKRVDGLEQIEVFNSETMESHEVSFDEPVYSVSTTGNAEYKTKTLRFRYESLVIPDSTYDYDMVERSRELLKRDEILGGYNPDDYTSERIWATAEDGVKVPISLVYKKGLKKDGTAATLLYGYGSYGSTTDPTFTSTRLPLLDRGMIFAIGHIRGSGDLGRPWYEDGKLMHKKNTFTDFIACAEHLINEGYTNADRLAIRGGSAGGLLVGAVVNMRPELFEAVVAKVPFVDVMNTMMDETIPLTVIEWEEWGDPRTKPAYDYMRSYSPYDNVKEQAYPHMLITAGLNDPRVGYWEPAKWTAKLRAHNQSDNLIVLKTNMGAGHGGASGRYAYLEELALDYAFVLRVLGVA